MFRQPFFTLDFGLPTAEVAGLVQTCLATGERTGPVELVAVNRRGRSIICSLACSPLDNPTKGMVMLLEPVQRD